jgi:hypothetical protein
LLASPLNPSPSSSSMNTVPLQGTRPSQSSSQTASKSFC